MVDGDALMLTAILDKNYSPIAQGQFLHLVYICERILQIFTSNGGVCHIVFFDIWKKIYNNCYKLLLCRQVLYYHFTKNTNIPVHKIEHFYSSDFISIVERVKSRFLLCNLAIYKDYIEIAQKVGLKPPKFVDKWPPTLILYAGELFSCISNYIACVDIETLTIDVSTVASYIVEGQPETVQLSKRVQDYLLDSFTIDEDGASLSDGFVGKNARETLVCNAAVDFLTLHPKRANDLRLILATYATMDCFKLQNRGCPEVSIDSEEPRKDARALVDLWMQLLHKVLMSSIASEISDWRNIGDLWQGTLFFTVLCAVSEDVEDAEKLGAISGRYEYYVGLVNAESSVPLDPYPLKPFGKDISYEIFEPKCKSHGNYFFNFLIVVFVLRYDVEINLY